MSMPYVLRKWFPACMDSVDSGGRVHVHVPILRKLADGVWSR